MYSDILSKDIVNMIYIAKHSCGVKNVTFFFISKYYYYFYYRSKNTYISVNILLNLWYVHVNLKNGFIKSGRSL